MPVTLRRPERAGPLAPTGSALLDLGTPAARSALYARVGVLLFALALAVTSQKPYFDFVTSDGRAYYVYLPSLVIDGDLDFSNQIVEHWHGDRHLHLEDRTERGLVRNKYPVGPALTLAPAFLAAHGMAHVGYRLTGASWCAPDGYSIPYQVVNVFYLIGLVVLSLAFTDRLLREAFRTDPALTARAVLLFWLGSPLLYYTFREPFMAHAPGLFWVSASLLLVWGLLTGLPAGRLPAGHLFLLSFTAAMALLCRASNGLVLLPFYAYLLAQVCRAGLAGRLLRLLPAALAGMAPFALQALVWQGLYGRFFLYSYEGEGFHWARPAGWQTLFSSRHGLFFWSPLLLTAAGGFLWRLWCHPHPLAGCFAASFLLLWYCNSAWHCWWFGHAFGGRAFLELSPLFILGLVGAFELARRAGPRARRACLGALALALLYHYALMGLYILERIPRGDYLW